jgi:hypothetical protein
MLVAFVEEQLCKDNKHMILLWQTRTIAMDTVSHHFFIFRGRENEGSTRKKSGGRMLEIIPEIFKICNYPNGTKRSNV